MSLKVSKLFRFLSNVVELKIILLFQASKGRDQVEFDGISDLPASDNESMNTADKPSLDRQGSIQVNYFYFIFGGWGGVNEWGSEH